MKKIILTVPLMFFLFWGYCHSAGEEMIAFAEKAESSGDKLGAIEFYFKFISKKNVDIKSKASAMGKLGKLLNDTERYEEAERILSELVSLYPSYASASAYEELLQIYLNFRPDSDKAAKLRNTYARRFGRTPALKKIDTTIKVMGTDYTAGAEVLKMPVKDISIVSYSSSSDFDREFFPVRNYVLKSVLSPDKKMEAARETIKGRSFLYVKSKDGNLNKIIPGSRGGFGAQWSWDGKKILFSSVNSLGERSLKVFDVEKWTVKTVFSGLGMETLACLSPDGEKIFFVYRRAPWIMSSDGAVIKLLNKDVRIKQPVMTAWSKDGGSVLVTEEDSSSGYIFWVYQLGKKTQ